MTPPKRPNPRQNAGATPGTYFLSLTVENIRCFGPPQTLDLSDGQGRHALWTIILGENGLGKTTLLTCLAWIATRRYRIGTGPSDWEWLSKRRGLIRGSGDAEAVTHAMVVCTTEPRRHTKIETKFGSRWSGSGWPSDDDEIVRSLLTFHYGASRHLPHRKTLTVDDERISLFLDDEVALRNPEDWLLTAHYNALLHGPEAKRFEAFATHVRNALVELLPEVAEVRIRPVEEPGRSPRVEARTPDGWVPLRQLGYGYQSQVAWLVDLASRMFERYPDSPDPLAEPAVVLVDEIDLHMHPRWQRQIIEFLARRFPRTQFIVTAHSPLIVQAAGDANIVLLRREGDHVVIDNDPEVLRNWRVDQILTSELFGLESARPPQIEEPLKERRQILAKSRLSARDRRRLAELEAGIGGLPAGESAEDRRAMELLRRAAAKLTDDDDSDQQAGAGAEHPA